MYDVAIVGAGPAGSTLARLLGRHQRVLLVDRRRLDAPFSPSDPAKTCGGLLAPAAQRELARQGLGVPAHVTAGPQLFAVRALDLYRKRSRLYQRHYVNVDREAFDRWLVSLVPPQVECAFGWTLEDLSTDNQGAFLGFRTAAGGRATVAARVVVGADGAASSVRRLAFGQALQIPRYTAIQAAFSAVATEPHYGALFDERLTDFYGWSIPKGDTTLLGGAFPAGPGVGERFEELVSRARAQGVRLGEELGRSSAMIVRPTSLGHLLPGADAVLLAGEAAGFVSPSSAEGISYALRSAASAADALAAGPVGAAARYRGASAPLAAAIAFQALKARTVYASVPRRLALSTGLGAITEQGRRAGAPSFAAR